VLHTVQSFRCLNEAAINRPNTAFLKAPAHGALLGPIFSRIPAAGKAQS
jgi:hypothetical protein